MYYVKGSGYRRAGWPLRAACHKPNNPSVPADIPVHKCQSRGSSTKTQSHSLFSLLSTGHEPYYLLGAASGAAFVRMDSVKSDRVSVSAMEKNQDVAYQNEKEDLDELEALDALPEKYRGTSTDHMDMHVLGKRQVLRVCSPFNRISYLYMYLYGESRGQLADLSLL